jgi:hypothetical protein
MEVKIEHSIISKYPKSAPREVRSKRLTGEEQAEIESMESDSVDESLIEARQAELGAKHKDPAKDDVSYNVSIMDINERLERNMKT